MNFFKIILQNLETNCVLIFELSYDEPLFNIAYANRNIIPVYEMRLNQGAIMIENYKLGGFVQMVLKESKENKNKYISSLSLKC